jgi:hypothetical protein
MFQDAPLGKIAVRKYIGAKLDQITRRSALGHKFDEIEQYQSRVKVQSELYDELYRDLDALDAKAGRLCQANAITFGLLTIFLDKITSAGASVILGAAYILSLAGLILSMSVLFVKWTKTSNVQCRTLEEMVESICSVRSGRTIRYRMALYASIISAVIVCLYSANSKVMTRTSSAAPELFYKAPEIPIIT